MTDTAPEAESFTAQDVTYGDLSVRINRLMPQESYRLFEVLRPEIGRAVSAVNTGDSKLNIASFVAIVGVLSPEAVEVARKRMFERVFFTRPNSHPSATQLLANEDAAFEGLSAFHIYDLLLRCFTVNFLDSWEEIHRLLDRAGVLDMIPSQLATSSPSSPTP